MYDVVIKNGTVIDGTGSVGKKMDVAIEKGKIVEISPEIKAKSRQTINATDRIVAPGFIDIQNHSDSYWTIFDQPDQLSLLSQGVTTIIMGNCGSSLAPLLSSESIKTIQKWHNVAGLNINWTSVSELLLHLSTMNKGVNVGTLVGHATLRRGLVADDVRQLKKDELMSMSKALDDGLNQGAFGLSMGLIYAHEVNSSAEELKILAEGLKPANKYLNIHLRSEAHHVLESVDEALELASSTGVALKISHLKIRGEKNWHLFDYLINKLELAYHQGLNISFDVYPYNTSWSVLYTYLPKWAYEGGRPQILKMISEPASRRKILDYMRSLGEDFGRIVIAEAWRGDSFIGKSLSQIAQNQEVSSEEALLNVISATNAQAMVFDHNLSAEQVQLLCMSPLSMISTDGAGYSGKQSKLIHPRCFGTFPRFLRWVQEKKILKWENAIRKLTAEPAKLLGLADRGTIAVNNAADFVIFDPHTVTDHADYKKPDLLSDGIDMVLVNGKIAYADKKVVSLNGSVVRR
jgi:N-acyl-D-amino-acid deacylase